MSGDALPRPTVVWWRESVEQFRVPRLHSIGWVDTTGYPRGTVEISSRHLRIDRRTIEAALATELVPQHYPAPPAMAPTDTVEPSQLDTAARLIIDGHTIITRELVTSFGLDVVAGITAQLLGAGPRAVIVLDRWLSPPVRQATTQAAHDALADFATAAPRELCNRGWTRQPDDRWQLLLHQT